MPKTAAGSADSARRIPSMERILSSAALAPLIAEFSRDAVKDAVSQHLDRLRESKSPYDEADAVIAARTALQASTTSSLRPVINATGILIHTNLGRSPIDARIWSAAQEIVRGYSNLEFNLEEGERG